MSKLTDIFLKFLPKNLQQKLRNRYYEIKISKSTEKDEEDLIIISMILGLGQCAIDIGANFGLYTKHLSAYVGNDGKVFSFEPIDQTFSVLKHNIKALHLSNVDAFNLAISDKEGTANMIIPEYDNGGENFYEASISSEESSDNSESVKTISLDQVIPIEQKVDFIKIDVEGHEIQALQGSEKTIEHSKPIMLIEINGGITVENENSQAILSFLKRFNFAPFIRNGDKLVEVKNESDGFNFFFLTPEHKKKFSAIIVG